LLISFCELPSEILFADHASSFVVCSDECVEMG
jgi:hypothetical protein